jgi:hypothetical protein
MFDSGASSSFDDEKWFERLLTAGMMHVLSDRRDRLEKKMTKRVV